MIIRHAEKHQDGSPDKGVSIEGIHTKHELTVRGWQRAGALVRFFAPVGGFAPDAPISTPATIIASAATPQSPSRRAIRTVEMLAAAVGTTVDARFQEGEEAVVAAAALAGPSPVLISWHHSNIVPLAQAIAGPAIKVPAKWPDDRFDLVWVFDRADEAGDWRFSQVPQLLFGHDRPEPI